MDDPRIEWVRDRVHYALDVKDPEVFEELINRDDGEAERAIAKFLNETPDESNSAILFYKIIQEEEEEVEVECEPSIPDIQPEDDPEGEGQNEEENGGNASPTHTDAPSAASPSLAGDGDEDGKSKKGKRKKKGKGKDEVSEPDPEPPKEDILPETPKPEPEPEAEGDEDAEPPQLKMRIEIQKVEKTYLYMCYGHLPEEVMKENCVYFMRNTPGMVPLPNTVEEANEQLPALFEIGLLSGHSLVMLEQVISQIYMPLLSFNQHKNGEADQARPDATPLPVSRQSTNMTDNREQDEDEPEINVAESRVKALLRDEFLINMQKFASSINRTIQQIEGEVRLEVPDLVLSENMEDNLRNQELMDTIGVSCQEWIKQITEALDSLNKKKPQGEGPLAEIDYWRERNAALSALYEQLKLPRVRDMLVLYGHVDNAIEYLRQDLNKFYTEAKDNVRFLSTLERHFKNITHGATFQVVIETIPSMMNALRMVWIISRHYNQDERMVPLMERIAWELAERVARVINVRTLYKDGPDEVKHKTSEAKKMLELWKESYFEVRAKIEASGRDSRWEFDRKKKKVPTATLR